MPGTWRPQPQRTDGRVHTRAERNAAAAVRARAEAGEPCVFCHQGFDWTLPPNHRWAFTCHHAWRVMHGGPIVQDPGAMFPAHRTCNSADGLRAQNARRKAGARTTTPRATPPTKRPPYSINENDLSSDEPHSRDW